jgi:signal transduction histidine kinase
VGGAALSCLGWVTLCTSLATVRTVPPGSLASRDDAWWARVAAVGSVIVGVVALLADHPADTSLEVVTLSAVVVLGFLAKSVWPVMPPVVLLLWTGLPPVYLNARHAGEGTMFLLILAVSYATLTEPDRRRRIAYGVVGVATPLLLHSAYAHWGWPYWMMGVLFGWLMSTQMRTFRLLVAQLEAARERLAEQAVSDERRRIAAELHDLVGHSLTVVLLHLTGARRRVRADPEGAERALAEAEEIGRRSLAEIRSNVAILRGDGAGTGTVPMPVARDVPNLVASAASAGADVRLVVHGSLDDVEGVVGLAVYRVLQESLSNAAKHAPGAQVSVDIGVADDAIDVVVVDLGGHPIEAAPPGVGLIGMRERVESLGGTLVAGPFEDGWRVVARLPRTAPSTPVTSVGS